MQTRSRRGLWAAAMAFYGAIELQGTGIAVNALAPERAVATEGATAVMDLPPEWCEPVETMADAALGLAACDPEQENGLVVRSGPYLRARGLVP